MSASTASHSVSTLVVTDLDGTLLDHHTYSFSPARPALTFLQKNHIPLVLASSKTAAEIATLRKELGFDHCPAIVENGAGILEPGSRPKQDTCQHARLMDRLNRLPGELRRSFSGFSDWTLEETAERTGLSLDAAEKALRRQFSEPGLWLGDKQSFERFQQVLTQEGIIVQQGGRYVSVSFGGNKADQLATLAKSYGDGDDPAFVIALGDAHNDIAMLEAADLGIIIPNPDHAGIPHLTGEKTGAIVRASKNGPEGWNETLMKQLAHIGFGNGKADG